MINLVTCGVALAPPPSRNQGQTSNGNRAETIDIAPETNTGILRNATRPTDADYFATCQVLVAELATTIRPHMPEKINLLMAVIGLAVNGYPLRGKALPVPLPACTGVPGSVFVLPRVLALCVEIIHKRNPRYAQWFGSLVKTLAVELSAQWGGDL